MSPPLCPRRTRLFSGRRSRRRGDRGATQCLQSACRAQRLQFRAEAPWQARAQAVLARGDRAVGEALLAQRRPGARHFLREMTAGGVDPECYLQAQPPEAALPWDFVALGASAEEQP